MHLKNIWSNQGRRVAGNKFWMKDSLKNFFQLINKVNEFHISFWMHGTRMMIQQYSTSAYGSSFVKMAYIPRYVNNILELFCLLFQKKSCQLSWNLERNFACRNSSPSPYSKIYKYLPYLSAIRNAEFVKSSPIFCIKGSSHWSMVYYF